MCPDRDSLKSAPKGSAQSTRSSGVKGKTTPPLQLCHQPCKMAPFQKICRELAKLPVELAHQIISDLKIWDVLKLVWFDDPRINAALSSHHECRTLLGEDEETFSQTAQTVKSYVGLYVKAGLPFKPPPYGNLSLGVDLLLACLRKDDWHHEPVGARGCQMIMTQLKEPIWSFLNGQIYALDGMDLERYLDRSVFPNGIPNLYTCKTPQDFEECMEAVLSAKKVLLKRTSDQLYWAASLLEKNTDILKKTLDPAQKPRSNMAHIVSRMRYTANCFAKCDLKRFISSELFAFYFFPLIPFDTALADLLQWMEKYGLFTNRRTDDGKHAHPSYIEKHAKTVIEGMPYFFRAFHPPGAPEETTQRLAITNEQGKVRRTMHTPWSDANAPETSGSTTGNDPSFTVHRIASRVEYRLPVSSQGREPNDEREQAWLESFVNLYRYLESLEKTTTLGEALEKSL